jgi:hypothetical protein
MPIAIGCSIPMTSSEPNPSRITSQIRLQGPLENVSRSRSRVPSRERAGSTLLFHLCGAVLLAALLEGCNQSVVLAARPDLQHETEPNDSASQASWCGVLVPGTRRIIAGHIQSEGPDIRDGFAFTAGSPCSLRVRLLPSLPGTDLDLCVYEPTLDAFTLCFDGTEATEVGEIALAKAGTEVQLVICSAWASSSYSLEIEALPLTREPPPPQSARGKHTLDRLSDYRSRMQPRRINDTEGNQIVARFGAGNLNGENRARSLPRLPARDLAIGVIANLTPESVSGRAAELR